MLSCEELETRLVPAKYRWNPLPWPLGTNLWSSPANWDVYRPATQDWATAAASPAAADDVSFDGTDNSDCVVDVAGGVTIERLVIIAPYTGHLVLSNPLTTNTLYFHSFTLCSVRGAPVGSPSVRGVLTSTGDADLAGFRFVDVTYNANGPTLVTQAFAENPATGTMIGSDFNIRSRFE